jgi:hypothetical protein
MTDLNIGEKKEPFSNNQITLNQDTVMDSFNRIILYIYYIWWRFIFLTIWIVAGLSAFLASFACVYFDSSIGDKIAGLLIAMLFGPFFWFFYIYKSSYCNSYPAYMPVVNYYD